MKKININYEDGAWSASANPPITLEDQIILFSNKTARPCQIVFVEAAAFGIIGIAIAPGSEFALVFRGVATEFLLLDIPIAGDTHNPTIPPGMSG